MRLNGETAIIFGGALAKASARQGARVFLSRRNGAPAEAVAIDITAVSGVAAVAGTSGGIEVMLNAIAFRAVQGEPLSDLDGRRLEP